MRGELVINLKNLQHNYRALNSLSSENCETAAVVKANAYGLGVEVISPSLYSAGARVFFVATLDEGVQLRSILSDVKIFILGGFWSPDAKSYAEYNLIPVLNSLSQINAYQDFAKNQKRSMPAILHFDIGMNRLGIPSEELEEIYCADLGGIEILYVMGHLSSSEEEDNPHNDAQRKRFEDITSHFLDIPKCLSNSGGVFLGDAFHYDLTRPGICLYGGCANEKMKDVIRPVISLHVPILQIHKAKKGETVAYNETYCMQNNSDLAILPFGYADGVFRSLGNVGCLYYSGYELPVRGRVSMDLIICDLKAIPQDEFPKEGDMVEVIGASQSLDDFARSAGTISYEILTNLGRRYKRSIIE